MAGPVILLFGPDLERYRVLHQLELVDDEFLRVTVKVHRGALRIGEQIREYGTTEH